MSFALDDLISSAEANSGRHYELSADGMIQVTMTPSSNRHSRVSMDLALWLVEHFGKDVVRAAPGLVTKGQGSAAGGREPDLAVFHRRPDEPGRYNAPETVRLVVGIASPSTASIDFGEKVEEYAASGIAHYWIVDERDRYTCTGSPGTRMSTTAPR